MDKKEIRERLEDGDALQVRAIVQMVGKPKEHIEEALHAFVKKLEDMKAGFTIYDTQFAEAEQEEEGSSLFSTFCEIEMLCDDVDGLLNFCVEGMPASIEVIEPEDTTVTSHDITRMMNEVIDKLHRADQLAKEARQSNKIMSQSLGIMIQNSITILLNMGPRSKKEIAKIVGIDLEQLPRFLEKLVEDKRISEKDGKYSLVAPQQQPTSS